MASFRALTLQSGKFKQQQDADTLVIGAGVATSTGALDIETGTGAAITIGAATATSLDLGRSGQLTTVKGNFQVDGTETITGSSTMNGNVTFGDAITDTVLFKGRITSTGQLGGITLPFLKEEAHLIAVETSTTADTAGGAMSVAGGGGLGTGAGGVLNLDGGAGTTGVGAGGAVTIDGGASAGGAEGAITIGGTASGTVTIGRAATYTQAYYVTPLDGGANVLLSSTAGNDTSGAAAIGVDGASFTSIAATDNDLQDILELLDGAIAATSSTLQEAYVGGNTITTSAGEGDLSVLGTEDITLLSANTVAATGSTSSFKVQNAAATSGDATLDLDVTSANGTANLNLDSGNNIGINTAASGTINMGTDAVAQTVNVGTGAAAMGVTVGSATTTSSTTVDSGTGGLDMNSTGAVTLDGTSVSVDGTGDMNFTSTQATAATALVMDVFADNNGATSGATDLNIDANSANGTATLSLNTDAGGVLNLGNDATTSATNLHSGSTGTLTIGNSGTFTIDRYATPIDGGANVLLSSTAGNATSGAATIGVDGANFTAITAADDDLQDILEALDAAIAGSDSLQEAYVGGNTIATSAGEGDFDISGTEDITLLSANTVAATSSTSNFRVENAAATSGDATLAFNVSSANGTANITLDSGNNIDIEVAASGQIDIGTDAAAATVNVGTGGAAMSVTVGSATSTSSTTVDSGTGGLDMNSTGAVTLDGTSVSVDGTGDMNFTSTQATAATALVMDIFADNNGATSGATDLNIDANSANGTATMSLNVDAGGVINIGNDAVTGATNIHTGATGALAVGNSGTFDIGYYVTPIDGGANVLLSSTAGNDTSGASAIGVDGASFTSIAATDNDLQDILELLDGAITAGATLQTSYVAGNTITTSAGEGDLSVLGTEDVTFLSANTVAATSSVSSFKVQNAAATSGDATLEFDATSANGTANITLDSGNNIDIEVAASGQIDIGTDAAAATLNLGTGGAAMTVSVGSATTTSTTSLLAGASADMTFNARGGTAITLNEAGEVALDAGFTASSIIGALNELFDGVGGSIFTLVTAQTAGETIAIGNLVAIDDAAGTPKVFLADANGGTELVNPIGFAQDAAVLNGALDVIVSGTIAIADAEWDAVPVVGDVGKYVFMSATPGSLTLTAPSTSGDIVQKVGIVSIGGAGAVEIVVQIGDGVEL